jgi:hypothetical protein
MSKYSPVLLIWAGIYNRAFGLSPMRYSLWDHTENVLRLVHMILCARALNAARCRGKV